jgi:hypothetical protein
VRVSLLDDSDKCAPFGGLKRCIASRKVKRKQTVVSYGKLPRDEMIGSRRFSRAELKSSDHWLVLHVLLPASIRVVSHPTNSLELLRAVPIRTLALRANPRLLRLVARQPFVPTTTPASLQRHHSNCLFVAHRRLL